MQAKMARIRWRCRRGMLELDAILQPFFDQHFLRLTSNQKEDFERLLEFSDPQLYNWFIGSELPEDADLLSLVTLIKNTQLH